MRESKFLLESVPIAAKRPKTSRNRFYDPQSDLKKAISMCLNIQFHQESYTCATEVIIYFFMPISKSISKKKQKELDGKLHTNKPDNDNLEKLIFDCLVKAQVLKDDCIIAKNYTEKRYSFNPRTEIIVRALCL